jgi:hypothetical protein
MTKVGNTGAAARPQREVVKQEQPNFRSFLDAKPKPVAAKADPKIKAQLQFYNEKIDVDTRQVSNLNKLLTEKTDSSLPKHLKPLVAKYARDMRAITDREDVRAVQTPERDLSFAKEKVNLTDKLYNDIRHYTGQSKNPFAQRVIAAIGGQAGRYINPK